MTKIHYTFLMVLGLLALSPLSAQQTPWEGSIFLGASNFMGDVVEPRVFTLSETNMAYGLQLQRNISSNFGVRLSLLRGKLSGDDTNFASLQARAFSFENTVTEMGLSLVWEPWGQQRFAESGRFSRIISPYVFLGAGINFSNPETDFSKTTIDGNTSQIAEDQAADTQTANFTIPAGIGLRYDLSQAWTLGLELGLRPGFTDYLDGVSQAANPNKDDWYAIGGLNLTYRMGKQDRDGDGVADKDDRCPGLAGIAGLSGCPDADLDGVTDTEDRCPYQAGVTALQGCPDTDGDGISDGEDACPTEKGTVALRGCPDTDLDGITDAEDHCPTEAGTKAMGGCPDTDADGIADHQDKCPQKAGNSAFEGCPDTDADGIGDGDDRCPNTVGPITNDGCPEIKEEDQAVLDFALQNVLFELNSDRLLPNSFRVLDEVAALMQRYPDHQLIISGHTDNIGDPDHNRRLSESRARRCFAYLQQKGIPASRMTAVGYGATQPVADNATEAGQLQNRRVEFKLQVP